MLCKYLPPQEYLLENFKYNAETGEFSGNTFLVGNYLYINIGENFLVSRLIWRYMTGDNPHTIDHINGHYKDNHWENLQNVSPTEHGNKHKEQIDKCIYPGIYRTLEGWKAFAKINYETICIGIYDCQHKARQAQLRRPREIEPQIVNKEIVTYIDPKVIERNTFPWYR